MHDDFSKSLQSQNHHPQFNYKAYCHDTRFIASQLSLAYILVCFQHQQFLKCRPSLLSVAQPMTSARCYVSQRLFERPVYAILSNLSQINLFLNCSI